MASDSAGRNTGLAHANPASVIAQSASARRVDDFVPRANRAQTTTTSEHSSVVGHERAAAADDYSEDSDAQWQALLDAVEQLTGV